MTTASKKMILAIEHVVKQMGVGTNINLLHLIWAMVTGSFLSSRGTVHQALKQSGCTDAEINRSSQTLRTGQWQIGEMITKWREYVSETTQWELKTYEGWRVLSADVVVFPRLKLKGWIGKLYRGTFGKAIKAVGLGVIVEIGHYAGCRVPLLRQIVRSQNREGSEKLLKQDLLKAVSNQLQPNEVLVHDAGVKIKDVREAGIENYIIRLAKNSVARRNYLPRNAHGNRQYGTEIRPQSRMRKGTMIEATKDPDIQTSFSWQERSIEAHSWQDVVGAQDKVSDDAPPYDIWLFLILCLMSPCKWGQPSKRQLKRYLKCTLTGGLLNRSLWWLSRELVCPVNMSLSQNVAGGYQSFPYWPEICSPMWRMNYQRFQLVTGIDFQKRLLGDCSRH